MQKLMFVFSNYRYKIAGVVLLMAGMVAGLIFVFTDFRLLIRFPALVSSFMETKFFLVTRTNILDELVLLLTITGLFLITFSKDRNQAIYPVQLAANAWRLALIANTALMLFSILFIYGSWFVYVMVINLVSVFVFYNLFYEVSKYRYRKNIEHPITTT
jgi:hypothetical protein